MLQFGEISSSNINECHLNLKQITIPRKNKTTMDHSPRRSRRPPTPNLPPPPQPPSSKPSDIFSTFIVHSDDSDSAAAIDDIDDDESLPPLLKRLPKDFGGPDFDSHRTSPHSVRSSRNSTVSQSSNPRRNIASHVKIYDDGDSDDDGDGDFGTFVVKKGSGTSNRNSTVRKNVDSYRKNDDDGDDGDFGTFVVKKGKDEEEEEDEEEEFGTFVVRKTGKEKVSAGTTVRRTGGGSSTMSRAVASMQAAGELGFGGRSKRSGGGSGQSDEVAQVRQLQSKMSSSSIPDCINREDPCLKYELLHELGESVDFGFIDYFKKLKIL